MGVRDGFPVGLFDALPAGVNGRPLQADSSQPSGLGYATRTFDFNNQNVLNVGSLTATQLAVGSATDTVWASSLTQQASGTFGGTSGVFGTLLNDTINVNSPNVSSLAGPFGVFSTYTISDAGNTHTAAAARLAPTLKGTNTGMSVQGLDFEPSYQLPTIAAAYGLFIAPSLDGSGQATTAFGAAIGFKNTSGLTTTTLIGLDIGVQLALQGPATNMFSMRIGTSASLFRGLASFNTSGITDTSAVPTYGVHLKSSNFAAQRAKCAVGLDIVTNVPTSPGVDATIAVSAYKSATPHYYILFTFNDSVNGVTYAYTQLDGLALPASPLTWSASTTLPP